MILWVDQRLKALVPVTIWLVIIPLAFFILHDIALVVELLLVHCWKHPTHPVRFEPKCKFQVSGRDCLEVVGSIEPGGRIKGPPSTFDQFKMLVLRDMLGTLEHHVLKQVREARVAGKFISRPNPIPNIHCHYRHSAVLGKDYF